jgi:hypothetical protein
VRLRTAVAVVACALGALASPAVAQGADLFAVVGPDFNISLRDAQGVTVTQLDPGPYRIFVEDRSDFHNFHLFGPGVERATSVELVQSVVWEVTFVEGRYRFVCDPHATDMRGAFVVGNPPPPPAPPPRLIGTVGANGAISLTMNGRRVVSLAAGRYTVVVRDRSRRHNFHLIGPGVNRRTAVARIGTFTWALTFRAGVHRFVSDPQARRIRRTFTVR